ncbi:MAG: hemerythrin domain-containing protein [Solirubrobacterales bacterium]
MIETNHIASRRDMIRGAGLAAGAVLALGETTWAAETNRQRTRRSETAAADRTGQQVPSTEPTPIEDLSREHALASRLLLVYEASIGMPVGVDTSARPAAAPDQLRSKELLTAAGMLRQVVEDYHVRLEEDYLFPVFEKANRMTDMIAVLRQQHAAARSLTDAILKGAGGGDAASNLQAIQPHVQAYVNMLRAHAAHEETVLYPQLRAIASADEINQLQRTFAENEKKRLGVGGFNGLVTKVIDLERTLNLNNLAMFTPKTMAGQTPTATERQ